MTVALAIERVRGAAIRPWLDALARLRVEVFRDFPYLYQGSAAYEARYLEAYAACDESVVVLARDGDAVVGAATGLPLAAHGEAVVPPLLAAGFDVARVFYLGESVLLPAYRGRGLGHAFFDGREAAAREAGATVAAFCAVERPADHPRRPAGYRPLDDFWARRGYVRRPDIRCRFSWQDLDDPPGVESEKAMVFWIKELGA